MSEDTGVRLQRRSARPFTRAARTAGGRRIAEAFERAAAEGRAALVGYWPAGYPSPAASEKALVALVRGGCDVLEVGVPFSDPVADGPVLQEASARALQAGMSLRGALEVAGSLSSRAGPSGMPVPVVIMSYYNPLLQFDERRLAEAMRARGLCGAIVPDLPVEECEALAAALEAGGLAWIGLAAPTSRHRLSRIASRTDGFVYAVSRTGVTGMQGDVSDEARELVEALRAETRLPVALGFGVWGPEQARALAFADGVVVGSAFVDAWNRAAGTGSDPVLEVEALARRIRNALAA